MCIAGERDLGGAGEEEAVLLELVDVRLLGREEARADHRLLADEHRRQHRREPGRGDVVEREAVEREREQRGVADDVAEPRSGEARGALELEAADLARLLRLRERRRLAEAADLDGVVLGVAVRRRVVRRVRDERERLVAGGLGGGELLLGGAQLLLHAAAAPRAARASACPSASSGCGDRRRAARAARQRSSAASSASNASPAPLRASAARQASGSARAALRSIMRASLGRRRSRWRHPPRSRSGRSSRRARAAAGSHPRPRSRSRPRRSARCRSRRRRTRRCARARCRAARRRRRCPVPFDTAGLPSSRR